MPLARSELRDVEQLHRELNDSQDENHRLRDTVAALTDRLAAAAAANEELRAAGERARAENEALTDRLAAADAANEELRAAGEQARAQNERLAGTVTALTDRLAAADAANEELRAEDQAVRAERDATAGKVAALSHQLSLISDDNTMLRQGAAGLRKRFYSALAAATALCVVLLGLGTVAFLRQRSLRSVHAIVVLAPWNAENTSESRMFRQVTREFTTQTGVPIAYVAPPVNTKEDFASWYLANANSADVTLMPQPALMRCAVEKHQIHALPEDVVTTIKASQNANWAGKGAMDGRQYGLVFKIADKSAVWYNRKMFQRAGIKPESLRDWGWAEFWQTAKVLGNRLGSASAVLAVGASNNQWVLTDWFENIYARVVPGGHYAELAQPRLEMWQAAAVRDGLGRLQAALRKGGVTGDQFSMDRRAALAAFQKNQVAMIVGDFARDLGADRNAGLLPFPSNSSSAPDIFGADIAVLNRDSHQARQFLQFLAGRSAAEILADAGYMSPRMDSPYVGRWPELHKAVSNDPTTEAVFDLSDQLPIQFGSKPGRGMQKVLADLVLDRTNPVQAQQALVAGIRDAPSACPR